jgi:hypothetical protein
MSLGLAFWILMIIWAVFGAWANRAAPAPGVNQRPVVIGGALLLFVLLLLLGWSEFGAPFRR